MVKGKLFGEMVIFMKENLKMVKELVLENINGLMVIYMKVNL